jgi:hypothetical protein
MNVGLYGHPARDQILRRPALVLLEQRAAINSPQLDFVNWYSAEFDDYEIRIVDMIPVGTGAARNICMRCSTDGGATFDTGNNYSSINFVQVVAGSGTGGANATNRIDLIPMGSSNANWGASGVFQFSNPAGARYKQIHGTSAAHDFNRGATDVEINIVAGAYLSVSAVNALRFLINAGADGNISSGIIRIYGVAKQ